jgi:hypothetical protein
MHVVAIKIRWGQQIDNDNKIDMINCKGGRIVLPIELAQ